MWTDNRSKIVRVNRNYLARINLLKSQRLSRNTKLKLHKTQIPSILTCEQEVCKMITDEKKKTRIISFTNFNTQFFIH